MKRIHLVLVLALAGVLAGCASAPSGSERRGFGSLVDADQDAGPLVGQGAHRVRFVLRDPHTGEPLPHHPYALSHGSVDLPFVAGEKDVYQGITDGRGRTAVFAFDRPPPREGFFLRPRLGEGDHGEQFRLTLPGDEPAFAQAYTLVICTDPPQRYLGYSDRDGHTAYVASAQAGRVQLFLDHHPDATCTDEGENASAKHAGTPEPPPDDRGEGEGDEPADDGRG